MVVNRKFVSSYNNHNNNNSINKYINIIFTCLISYDTTFSVLFLLTVRNEFIESKIIENSSKNKINSINVKNFNEKNI